MAGYDADGNPIGDQSPPGIPAAIVAKGGFDADGNPIGGGAPSTPNEVVRSTPKPPSMWERAWEQKFQLRPPIPYLPAPPETSLHEVVSTGLKALPAAAAIVGTAATGGATAPVWGGVLAGLGGSLLKSTAQTAMNEPEAPPSLGAAVGEATHEGLFQGELGAATTGLGLAMDALGIGESIPGTLKGEARQSMAKALGAKTGKEITAVSQRVSGPLLEEGGLISASQKSLQEKVITRLQDSADKLVDMLEGAPGQTRINTRPVIYQLEKMKEQFLIKVPQQPGTFGTLTLAHKPNDVFIPTDEMNAAAVAKIDTLEHTIDLMGNNVTVKELNDLKSKWVKTFTSRAPGTPVTAYTAAEGQSAGILRSGADAIRAEIAQAQPEIADIGRKEFEYARAGDMLAVARERAQSSGVTAGRAALGGMPIYWLARNFAAASAGPAAAASVKVAELMEATLLANALGRSTLWRTTSAATKYNIASMLAEGRLGLFAANAARILEAERAITAPEPSPPPTVGFEQPPGLGQ